MSGIDAPEKLRRRPVRGEGAKENVSPQTDGRETAEKDPFVMEGEEDVEDEWGLDDEDWQPGERDGKEGKTPAIRRVQR